MKQLALPVLFALTLLSCGQTTSKPNNTDTSNTKAETSADPFANAVFKLDDSKSAFKYAKSTANLFLYTISGKENQSSEGEPMVTVTPMPIKPGTTPEAVATMLISSLEKFGLSNQEVKNTSSEKVNGYDAYEQEMQAGIQGKESTIYQLIVIHEGRALAIQGIMPQGTPGTLEEMKKLSHTIQFK